MLTSITPLGERGRGRRWGLTATWYVIGSILGGVAIGSIAGALGAALGQLHLAAATALAIAAAGCLLAALADARGIAPRSWRRQVDETWLGRYRGWVVGGGFGVQLGFALVTIVSSASVYAALLIGVLTRSFWGGLAVGVTFGLMRALPLLTVRDVRAPETLAAVYRRVSTIAPLARRVTAGVLGLAGLALAITAGYSG